MGEWGLRERIEDKYTNAMSQSVQKAAPYSVLAVGYDRVMQHVEYGAWAQHVHQLLQAHRERPIASILELGCGTGSLALQLQPLGDYTYRASDASPQMVRVAEIKAQEAGLPVTFAVRDFTDFAVAEPVDAIVLLYDGLNYLLEVDQVEALMECAYEALRPEGLFCFDQSTPHNSAHNADDFTDAGAVDGFSYVRESEYDPETNLHTTTFELSIRGDVYREVHQQRAYAKHEVESCVAEAGFAIEAAYADFTTEPASPSAERIHWLARRPEAS